MELFTMADISMASRRLIKGIRSLAPKAFKTTKLSPVILPSGVMIVVTDFIAEVGIKCRMVKKSPVTDKVISHHTNLGAHV